MCAGKVETMKAKLLTLIGVSGSALASLFGGWDAALKTLIIFMAIYIAIIKWKDEKYG